MSSPDLRAQEQQRQQQQRAAYDQRYLVQGQNQGQSQGQTSVRGAPSAVGATPLPPGWGTKGKGIGGGVQTGVSLHVFVYWLSCCVYTDSHMV